MQLWMMKTASRVPSCRDQSPNEKTERREQLLLTVTIEERPVSPTSIHSIERPLRCRGELGVQTVIAEGIELL